MPAASSCWPRGERRGQPARRAVGELVPAAEASGDASYLAQLLSQIARAQCLQRQYDDADATLDRAEALLTAESHLPRVRCLLERGRIRNDQLQGDRGRAAFLEAWEIGRRQRIDNHAVDAAHMLGIIAPQAEAIEWNLRALEYAGQSPDPKARRWAASLSNNLGWAHGLTKCCRRTRGSRRRSRIGAIPGRFRRPAVQVAHDGATEREPGARLRSGGAAAHRAVAVRPCPDPGIRLRCVTWRV